MKSKLTILETTSLLLDPNSAVAQDISTVEWAPIFCSSFEKF